MECGAQFDFDDFYDFEYEDDTDSGVFSSDCGGCGYDFDDEPSYSPCDDC